MERTTTKHGRLTDEMLQRETESLTRGAPVESRIEESRMAEPAGEGEFVASAVLHTLDEPLMGMPADEIVARSELAAALRPSAFPADAPTLLRVAEATQAPEWVRDTLRRVDQVTRFANVQALWEGAGGHRELRTRPHEPAPEARRSGLAEPPRAARAPQPAVAQPNLVDAVFDFARAGWRLTERAVHMTTAPMRWAGRVLPGPLRRQ